MRPRACVFQECRRDSLAPISKSLRKFVVSNGIHIRYWGQPYQILAARTLLVIRATSLQRSLLSLFEVVGGKTYAISWWGRRVQIMLNEVRRIEIVDGVDLARFGKGHYDYGGDLVDRVYKLYRSAEARMRSGNSSSTQKKPTRYPDGTPIDKSVDEGPTHYPDGTPIDKPVDEGPTRYPDDTPIPPEKRGAGAGQ